MDIRQAELFLALADHDTLSDAAAAAGISAAAMSRALTRLEREFKIALFHRSARGLQLTPAGRALVRPAREVLHSSAVARSAVANVHGQVTGHLGIVSFGSAFGHLSHALGSFRQRYPAVRITIEEASSETDVLRRLRARRAELGFGYLCVEDPGLVGREFVRRRIGYDEIGLLVPANWTSEIALSALPDLPTIVPPSHASARTAIETKLRSAGARTRLGVTTVHQHMQAPLVENGFGMAWVSRGSRIDAAHPGASFRGLTPPLVLPVDLVHSRRELTAAARAFVSALLSVPPPGLLTSKDPVPAADG